MAQSFKRQLKRGNLVAIWNPTLKQYDFFRRAKNTGRYLLTHAFNRNGGESKITLFRNINQSFIDESIEQIVKDLGNSQIFVLPGGFSAGDEPDGSGKFIAAVLQNPRLKEAIEK